MDSTRSAVRTAPSRTILGRHRETGSNCTTEKIGSPATHWKSIKSWPDPMIGAAVEPAAGTHAVPILPSILSISPRLPPLYLLPRRPSRHSHGAPPPPASTTNRRDGSRPPPLPHRSPPPGTLPPSSCYRSDRGSGAPPRPASTTNHRDGSRPPPLPRRFPPPGSLPPFSCSRRSEERRVGKECRN